VNLSFKIVIFLLGEYYNYDSSISLHHDSIMSDQLAGFWYLRLCGHKYEVNISKEKENSIFPFQGFRKRTS
jgi:uncharacterized protein (DUF608 family)